MNRTSGVQVASLDLRLHVGRAVMRSLGHAGRFAFLMIDMIRGLPQWRIWLPRTFEQASHIGFGSLFIVMLVAGFAGAVTALQTAYQFTTSLIPAYYAGGIVTASVILELGPVLTGLILAGRIGARYAAELGTMRVTEQIDALESLGRSPMTHLLLPRVLAGMLVIPVLVVIANVVGILSGFLAAKASLAITNNEFTFGSRFFFRPFDLFYSMTKAYAFAAAVTVIPCYVGYHTQQGAEGVGRAATMAVVAASVTILLLDTVLAQIMLG
jgi:phospholipid/cholesterol/gamma-HCH transport system permease protein